MLFLIGFIALALIALSVSWGTIGTVVSYHRYGMADARVPPRRSGGIGHEPGTQALRVAEAAPEGRGRPDGPAFFVLGSMILRPRVEARAAHGEDAGMESSRTKALVLAAALTLPLAGLALLLAVPDLDVHWEHHPSHFWLVLSVAFIDTVLGIAMSEAATRRDDARLFLVSMALLASAGFLALHALATPEAIVKEPNNGFVIATPIGLFLAAGFAAASAMQPEHGPGTLSRSTMRWLRWALIVVLVAWAAASLTGVSLLRGPAPSEAPTLLRILAPVAIGLYVFAAARYLSVYARRRRPLPLAVATAFILLAEAVLTIIVARSWHASWWEWHAMMAVAFLIVLLTARAEYRHEGSITAAFGGLYWSGRSNASIADRPTHSPCW